MRYDKRCYDKRCKSALDKLVSWVLTSVVLLVIAGCAGTQTKKQDVVDKGLTLKPTTSYIPVRQRDKEGLILPYQAAPNPYLLLKGKIKKESVENFIVARRAFKRKKFEQAEIALNKIVSNDKNLAGPWVMKGEIALQQGKLEDAVKHFKQAIVANKHNVNAYPKLALTLRKQGKYVLAQNVYADALAIWRDFPEAHLNLAVLYDIYINNPLLAQRHIEAYQFLTGWKDKRAATWLQEIRTRSGANPNTDLEEQSNTSQNTQTEGENIGT